MSPVGLFPTILQSKAIFGNGSTITRVTIKINYTGGAIQCYLGVSNAEATAPTSWEDIGTLTSGQEKTHTFTASGTWVFYKIIKDPSTIIYTVQDSYGQKTSPAITIKNFVEA